MKLRQLVQALLLLTLASAAGAHQQPTRLGTLAVVGNTVHVALALPVSVLETTDGKGGRQPSTEVPGTRDAALQNQIAQRFRIYDGDRPGLDLTVMPVTGDGHAASDQVSVLMQVRFEQPPAALRIETDLFGQAGGDQQLTINARRGDEVELAVLRPGHEGHSFFRSPWQVLGDFIVVGVEHILLGFDHLLFLLTVVVARTGWRQWLALITSFTVAHSVTLVLSVLGWVEAPSAIVEPLIAASIVLMALDNLRPGARQQRGRALVVFACGLLHGLGFATALRQAGLSGIHVWSSLLGFNVGVEIGQAVFLSVLMLLAHLLKPDPGSIARARCVQILSGSAALLGAVMLVQRIA